MIARLLPALCCFALAACSHRPDERPAMVYVPAGEFAMGSAPDDPLIWAWDRAREQPQHPVRVRAFYLDRHEVTNADFAGFKPDHRRHPSSACDECPVTAVTWYEARDYCAAQQKRLPTEAEWEKAAKGGTDGHPQPLEAYAVYAGNATLISEPSRGLLPSAEPVGRRLPNPYGLYDMLGNAREWTADWFSDTYYQLRIRDDPTGPLRGEYRVERGGSFMNDPHGVNATIRYNHPPTIRLFYVGFRCAQDP